MSTPIWKDTYVSLGSDAYADYRIVSDATSTVIYTGRAYMRPGASDNSIRINDICADYMYSTFPLPSALSLERAAVFSFTVQVADGPSWTTVGTCEFVYDWSYDYGHSDGDGMSFPVLPLLDPRQWLLVTTVQDDVTFTLTFPGGTSQVTVPVSQTADFSEDFNLDFSQTNGTGSGGTAILDLSLYPGVTAVEVGGITYTVAQPCNRYALYYLNAYGGYDQLLITGNAKQEDSVERYEMQRDYDNSSAAARGTVNYANVLTRTWTLHTGWLTDTQSLRMHNLINSTQVCLLDLQSRQIIPVIVDTDTVEYKTYENNGRELVSYELTVRLAQDRTRR